MNTKSGCNVATARRRYAAGVVGPDASLRLAAAFAHVRRERFLPPPPWTIYRGGDTLVTSDPESLYQDALIAINIDKGVNNGQPSLHAQWLSAIEPQPGERVLHVGCGGGYYTAILAALVGPRGRVMAYEIEPDVAVLAKSGLAGLANVEVHGGSGAAGPFPPVDVIYVNAAARAPERAWVGALAPGGRLIFPWRYGGGGEVATLIARSQDPQRLRFAALTMGGVNFISMRDDSEPKAPASDYARALRVRELVLRQDRAPDALCIADFDWAWFSA
jgi:protein-L-isoaspartate(D-aspartate) O-methyltransferase